MFVTRQSCGKRWKDDGKVWWIKHQEDGVPLRWEKRGAKRNEQRQEERRVFRFWRCTLVFWEKGGGLEIMCSYLHLWFYDVVKDSSRCFFRCHPWHAVRVQIGGMQTVGNTPKKAFIPMQIGIKYTANCYRKCCHGQILECAPVCISGSLQVHYTWHISRPGTHQGHPPSPRQHSSQHPPNTQSQLPYTHLHALPQSISKGGHAEKVEDPVRPSRWPVQGTWAQNPSPHINIS